MPAKDFKTNKYITEEVKEEKFDLVKSVKKMVNNPVFVLVVVILIGLIVILPSKKSKEVR